VTQVGAAPAFASVGEAIDMARAALGYLAAADAAQFAAEAQAECLRGLERIVFALLIGARAVLAREAFMPSETKPDGPA
jgi:hypothetical protein